MIQLFVLAWIAILFLYCLWDPFGPGRAEVRINPRVISDTEETAVFVGTLTIPRLRHIDGAEERSCTFDAKPQGVTGEMVRPMFSQTQSWRPGLD